MEKVPNTKRKALGSGLSSEKKKKVPNTDRQTVEMGGAGAGVGEEHGVGVVCGVGGEEDRGVGESSNSPKHCCDVSWLARSNSLPCYLKVALVVTGITG